MDADLQRKVGFICALWGSINSIRMSRMSVVADYRAGLAAAFECYQITARFSGGSHSFAPFWMPNAA